MCPFWYYIGVAKRLHIHPSIHFPATTYPALMVTWEQLLKDVSITVLELYLVSNCKSVLKQSRRFTA